MTKNPYFRAALILSVLLHIVLIGGLLIGATVEQTKKKPTPVNLNDKPIVKAAMVNSSDVQKQVDKIKQAKADQAKAERERQKKLKREQQRIKDLERQRKKKQAEKKAADAAAKKARAKAAAEKKAADKAIAKAKTKQRNEAAKAKKAADERKRQEKAAADAKAKRIAADKAAKKKAEKLRKEKLKREKEAKERAAQEAMIAEQMAAEQAQVNQARQRQVLSEVEKYTILISATIQRHWNVDESMKGKQCVLNIKLAPSGTVFSVKPLSGDKFVCKSAQDAIYKANTLPVSKDPEVYAQLKEINLTVQPEFN